MRHLDILIPFALPPAEFATDLLRELKTPGLAILLARAQYAHHSFDAFSRALPHESWLAQQSKLENPDSSPPVALTAMQSFALRPDDGVWFLLHPVHFHIARDHLVLTDLRQLALSEQESRALFDAALPLFVEAGHTLCYGDAQTWFVRADIWHGLQTATPDAACGHNIDIWMPRGEGERAWRKLQNEVQMLWFAHPVNAEREARGLRAVNSVWLWGGASVTAPGIDTRQCLQEEPSSTHQPIVPEIHALSTASLRSLWIPTFAGTTMATLSHKVNGNFPLFKEKEPHNPLILDDLIAPALTNDWSQWLMHMHTLENILFTPLLQALRDKHMHRISLIFTHHAALSTFTLTRASLRKFWVKPSLARLVP